MKKVKSNEELVQSKDYNQLLINNSRYILKVANSLNQDEYLDDLIQVGRIGLNQAMIDYDSTKNVPFIKYAGIHIKKEMILFLNNNSRQIRIPINVLIKDKLNEVIRPSIISYNQPINETGTELIELLFNDDANHQEEVIEQILVEVNKMSEKQQKLLKKRYGLTNGKPMTLKEISIEENVTKERIRQRCDLALNQLKFQLNVK